VIQETFSGASESKGHLAPDLYVFFVIQELPTGQCDQQRRKDDEWDDGRAWVWVPSNSEAPESEYSQKWGCVDKHIPTAPKLIAILSCVLAIVPSLATGVYA
jgi:hypothetical protein